MRIMLRDNFWFAELQEKATYGLRYLLTLPEYSDNSVLNQAIATNIAKVKTNGLNGMYWIIHHRFPNKLYYLNGF